MKKFVLILLAAAALVGTAGIASAQWYGGGGPALAQWYGGGYYGDRYYGDRYRERYYSDTTMTIDIIAGDNTVRAASTATDAFVRRASPYRTASANHIVATEVHLESIRSSP
jgi:hypothetical protein